MNEFPGNDWDELDRCPAHCSSPAAVAIACSACGAFSQLSDEVAELHEAAYAELVRHLDGAQPGPSPRGSGFRLEPTVAIAEYCDAHDILLSPCWFCKVERPDHLGRNCPQNPKFLALTAMQKKVGVGADQ